MKLVAVLRFFIPVVAITSLTQLLSFHAAVAPEVSRAAMGGRTIASFQEEGFNKRLERLEQCYGVRLDVKEAGIERGRSCKAILVHRLEELLGRGHYFLRPVKLVCRDVTAGAKSWQDWNGDAVYALLPNREQQVVRELEKQFLSEMVLSESKAREMQASCDKLLYCRNHWAWTCFWDRDARRRRLLHEALASRLFRSPAAIRPIVPELLRVP